MGTRHRQAVIAKDGEIKKFIKFPTPDGWYKVELMYIAENRADYYENDSESEAWGSEVDFIMDDDFEGIDWLLNNMDFEDIEDYAIKINSIVDVTTDDFWTSSDDFSIISN